MYKVKLLKTGGTFRSTAVPIGEPIVGKTNTLPVVGEAFIVSDEQGLPLFITTSVQHIERIDDEYRFRTLNSSYSLINKGKDGEDFPCGVV